MLRSFRGRLLAAAIVCASPLALTVPACAQVSFSISFDSFHDQLSPYGAWVYSDRWGTVWQPDVAGDFRPYDTGGHWENTSEYGWTWVSDYEWGDIAFHYGRWVNDPDDGWLWMPGYVWSPAWVVWRGNDDYIGWMPMPPDDNFLSGRADIGVSMSWSDPDRYYSNWYGPGYSRTGSMWVFVNFGHIADRNYHRYAVRRDRVPDLVRRTRNVTNYTVVNNYVVNRSVDVRRVERVSGRSIRPVSARQVFKRPDRIATVARSEQVRRQMLQEAPRGRGKPNSAPPPSQTMVDKLSDRTPRTGARQGPSHLFNKSTINQAGNRFKGGNARQNATGTPPAATTNGPAVQDRARVPRGFQNTPVQNGATVAPGPRNPGPDAVPGRTPTERSQEPGERRGHRPLTEPNVMPPANTLPADNADQRRGLRMQHTPPPVAPQSQIAPGNPSTEPSRAPRMQRSAPSVQAPPGAKPNGPDAVGPGERDDTRRGHRSDETGAPPPKRGDDRDKKPGSGAPPN